MKRVLAFLLVCLMVVCAGACGGKKKADPTAAPSQDPAVSVNPTEDPGYEDPTEDPGYEDPTEDPGNEDPGNEDPGDDVVDTSSSALISLAYDQNGQVYNAADSDLEIKVWGQNRTIETVYDGSKWASTMPGGSSFYIVNGLSNYYDVLGEAFTVEYYVNLSSAPAAKADCAAPDELCKCSYNSIGDCMEAGGFGVEVRHGATANQATLRFDMKLDSEYLTDKGEPLEMSVDLNSWYHVVVTWDGSVVSAYLNGELVSEYDSEWAFITWPVNETASHFAIGACMSANYSGGQAMVGQLGGFGLYTEAFDADTIAAMYNNL